MVTQCLRAEMSSCKELSCQWSNLFAHTMFAHTDAMFAHTDAERSPAKNFPVMVEWLLNAFDSWTYVYTAPCYNSTTATGDFWFYEPVGSV